MKYLKQYDIKCGDALEELRKLNSESIDMVMTSPPYFRMRDYKESRQIGMEDLPEQFIIKLCDIFLEVKRVLKPTGTLWVNIADTYGQNWRWGNKDTATQLQKGNAGTMDFMGKKGKDVDVPKKSLCCIPARFQIEMVRCGWALRNTIIWHKPNCLSGNTPIYVRSMGKPLRTTIREAYRLPIEKLEFCGINGWRKVIAMERKEVLPLLTIHLRNGMRIESTYEHLFMSENKLFRADKLKENMILDHATIPDEHGTKFGKKEIGWLAGIYMAEGSKTNNGKNIQFSLHKKEKRIACKIKTIVEKFNGSYRDHDYENSKSVVISGIPISIIDFYIDGYGAKNKHLSKNSFRENNLFLEGFLKGYLDGDGHYENKNNRWRIGFAKNREFEHDLRVVCNRLGYNLRTRLTKAKYQNGFASVITGEIRKERSGHFNQKDDYQILKIIKTKGITYEIEIDGDHLFLLADGTITHNCMPSSVKDRFTVDYEYLFFFSKSEKYYFKQQKEPARDWGNKTRGNYRGGTDDPFLKQCGLKNGNFSESGRNKRCVWTIPTQANEIKHFAMFPEKLVETPIAAGCPIGGLVLDPFAGVMTTGVVALKMGRNFLGIELVPQYVEIGKKRLDSISQPNIARKRMESGI